MSPLRTIRLVATREVRERALTKGYLIGTAVLVLGVVAAIVLPAVLGGDDDGELTLGMVGEAPAGLTTEQLRERVAASLPDDRELEVTELADREAAETAVEDGDAAAVLLDGRELLVDGRPDQALFAALEGTLQLANVTRNLETAGLSDDQISTALAPTAPLEVVDVAGEEGDAGFLLATLATILLVVAVQINGSTLLSGALEEKTNRVVEVLVSTARPWQLLAGKVLASSALAFGQLGLVVGAALASNAAVGAFELPSATGSVLAVSLVMLIAGFLFYAALFAVAGTLASSLEDAQSSAGPLFVLMYGAYGAVFAAVLPNPGGVVGQVLTFVPPTAPFVLPARVALGEVPGWQVPVSIVVTLIGALLVLRLAGRIYASSLLAGGKLTWAEAWRAEPVR